MPGYLFPTIRKITCGRNQHGIITPSLPLLVTLTDDAHAVREGLLARSESVPREAEYHLHREGLIDQAERDIYLHSDIGRRGLLRMYMRTQMTEWSLSVCSCIRNGERSGCVQGTLWK